MNDRQFEILHHSYRPKWASGEKFAEKLGITKEEGDEFPDWQYYILQSGIPCDLVILSKCVWKKPKNGKKHKFVLILKSMMSILTDWNTILVMKPRTSRGMERGTHL
jgi:hypothetical protein